MHPNPIVASSITTIVQILEREYREREELTYHERREFEALVGELRLLQAFLKDSSKIEEMSEVFREKERQIRELAYELEDTIEQCLVKKKKAAKKKNRYRITIIGRSLLEKVDYGMAREVRSIREKKVKRIIEMIEKDFKIKPGSDNGLEEPITEVRPRPGDANAASTWHDIGESHKPERTVDSEDEAKIISLLMEQRTRLDIISITGMPGLGKTTLARKILANEAIRQTFPLLVWIRVTQKFKIREAFLKLSKEIMGEEGTPLPTDQSLIPYIRHTLAKKKFLLVIDDVWTIDDWEIVQTILPEENEMGKVLVTTRHREIAVHANIFREPHEMSLLGQEKSLELLKLKVFGDPGICPPQLEDIAKDIADKCGGLPLSLVVIGGILKKQFTKTRAVIGLHEKWSNVLEDFYKILMKDEGSSMRSFLKLSYNALPNDHKPCFLYAGLFPGEHEIKVSELMRLWIDEGFLQPNGGKVEEMAEEILVDLINMNLLTVATKILDQVRTCRMHDIIREFCKVKAREENIFMVWKESDDGMMDRPISQARRLCLHSDPSKLMSAEPEVPRVRSLLCFLDDPVQVDPQHVSTIMDTFDVLRILNCKSLKFGELPKFSRLLLLKHITMSINALDVIPAYISKLPNLQTFVVYTVPSSVITVKAEIWKMAEVRCFKTNAAFVLDDRKWKGKGCRNLQIISNLSPQSCNNTLGRKAPNLNILGIRGDAMNLFTTFSLERFPLLKRLKVVNESGLHQSIILPQPHSFPVNLMKLTLSKTKLEWKTHMPTLATIKSLKLLKLKHRAFVGHLWIAEPDSRFDELQLLHLENSDLLEWKASPDHFPRLRCLIIKDCKGLSQFPTTIVKNLNELKVEGVSAGLADYAREIEAVKSQEALPNQHLYSDSGVPFKLTIT